MKKVLVLMLAVAMFLMMFSGCSVSQTSESPSASTAQQQASEEVATDGSTEPTAEDETFEVAVLISDMTATYASWLSYSFNTIASDYPQLKITTLDCGNDQGTQISNLENCITKGFDYVIVQPIDVTAIASAVNSVIDAGIPVCTVNGSNNGMDRASCVDCDPVQQGAIPAAVALEQIPENGNVVVLLGPSGNFHSNGRREGWEETFFAVRDDVTILDEQIANWSKDEGMALMEDWITKYGDKIDAVVSMNDAMALGCIEAAKAADLKGLLYYGVDGLADACLSIQAGELTATCVQNAYAQAGAALDIASRVLAGEIERETNNPDGELIDPSNVAKWITTHTENGQIKS